MYLIKVLLNILSCLTKSLCLLNLAINLKVFALSKKIDILKSYEISFLFSSVTGFLNITRHTHTYLLNNFFII